MQIYLRVPAKLTAYLAKIALIIANINTPAIFREGDDFIATPSMYINQQLSQVQ